MPSLAKALRARAVESTRAGVTRFVVSPEALVDCAAEAGVSVREAEMAALREKLVPERYLRNFSAWTLEEQLLLAQSRVAQVGLGGLGGHVLEMLARSGVGHIRVCDGDLFEPSNLNRQLLCTGETLGQSKALAAKERAALLNPAVHVEIDASFLDARAMISFVKGSAAVLDCLGGLASRQALQEAASQEGVPLVTAAMAGGSGYIATVLPGASGPADFMGDGAASEDVLGTPAPAVAFAASLLAEEALRILRGHDPLYAGGMLLFDLQNGTFERVQL